MMLGLFQNNLTEEESTDLTKNDDELIVDGG
jgi:hypothetical protein